MDEQRATIFHYWSANSTDKLFSFLGFVLLKKWCHVFLINLASAIAYTHMSRLLHLQETRVRNYWFYMDASYPNQQFIGKLIDFWVPEDKAFFDWFSTRSRSWWTLFPYSGQNHHKNHQKQCWFACWTSGPGVGWQLYPIITCVLHPPLVQARDFWTKQLAVIQNKSIANFNANYQFWSKAI